MHACAIDAFFSQIFQEVKAASDGFDWAGQVGRKIVEFSEQRASQEGAFVLRHWSWLNSPKAKFSNTSAAQKDEKIVFYSNGCSAIFIDALARYVGVAEVQQADCQCEVRAVYICRQTVTIQTCKELLQRLKQLVVPVRSQDTKDKGVLKMVVQPDGLSLDPFSN